MIINVEEHKIVLNGALNIRDLGGYPTLDGGMTKKGAFFRSDSLHNLTNEDITILKALGVTMQIDMRVANEIAHNPSKLLETDGITYYNVSLLDNVHSSGFKNMPSSMAEMYCSLLDGSREKYAAIFRAFLVNRGSCIFNCTAGKDRAGVVTMLLLNLADVQDAVIVADYSVSAANLASVIALHKQQMQLSDYQIPDYIFASEPEEMKKALKHLKENYTDTKGYLSYCGLSYEEIEQIRDRIKVLNNNT